MGCGLWVIGYGLSVIERVIVGLRLYSGYSFGVMGYRLSKGLLLV